jgi:hypothetical protein
MPGAYAHITMAFRTVNPEVFSDMGLEDVFAGQLMQHVGYFELGAISPDMPYLVGTGKNLRAIAWADSMHQQDVSNRIRAGVEAVAGLSGETRMKCLAWLLGFVEHVVFDVFMHPVVNKISKGVYGPLTKELHQRCEMNQDVYILLEKFNITDLSDAEIVRAVVQHLHSVVNVDAIDADVRNIFDIMLKNSSINLYSSNKPEIDGWFSSFVAKMKLQEGSSLLVGIGRHVGLDLIYPKAEDLDKEFIVNLPTPNNSSKSYDELFSEAGKNVSEWWGRIIRAVEGKEQFADSWFDGWNLDTGTDRSEQYSLWRNT